MQMHTEYCEWGAYLCKASCSGIIAPQMYSGLALSEAVCIIVSHSMQSEGHLGLCLTSLPASTYGSCNCTS